MTKPTNEQFGAYQGMYDYLNRELFEGALPTVLLNLSRAAGSKTVAFFAPKRWVREDDDTEVTHEISINPRHLRAGSALDTAQSLAHEMAHLWQHVAGKPSRAGYHNKQWAAKMIEIGLQPVDCKTGKDADHGASMNDRVIPGGKFDRVFKRMPSAALLPWACLEARPLVKPETGETGEAGEGGETVEEAPAPSKNKVKYSCPKCGQNAWGKPELLIGCLNVASHTDGEAAVFSRV